MKFLKKLCLSVISILTVLLSLYLIDMSLEKFAGHKNDFNGIYNFHANSTAVYQTGEFKYTAEINSLGFRGQEYYTPKKNGVIRIMVIGDSFSFGWGVAQQESWPSILEKELPEKIGKKVEVLNFSRPGNGPLNYFDTARLFLGKFNPDYLLIGLVSGDDLSQLIPDQISSGAQSPETKKKIARYLEIIGSEKKNYNFILNYLPNITGLISQSKNIDISGSWKKQLISMVNSFTDEELSKFEDLSGDVQNKFLTGYIQPWIVNSTVKTPDYITRTLNLDDNRTKNAVSGLNSTLKMLTSMASSQGTKTVIIDTPYDIFVSEKFAKAQQSMGLDFVEKSWESEIPLLISKQAAAAAGAKLISNIEFMRTGCPDDCYYYYDSHLNKKGHRIIANNILSEMEKIIQ